MSFSGPAIVFSLFTWLTGSLVILPAITLAQQPATRWIPFQVDNQLALQLPAPPRQVTDAEVTKLQVQSYLAQTPQALWILVRKALPATGPLPDQDISYTGLAQSTLTHWKAVGVHQASFQVGNLRGLTMDFRVEKPATGVPSEGTLWVLRIKRTVYVVQWLTQQPTNPDNAAQKQRFIASWALTQLPAVLPTAADFAPFRSGQFRTLGPDAPSTIITRTDTVQTEVNTALGLRIVYGLKWNKLGYDMTQRSSTSAHAALMQPKVIHVRITAVQGNTYWYWATIDDLISTGQIQRVK